MRSTNSISFCVATACCAFVLVTTGFVYGQNSSKLASPNQTMSNQVKQAATAMQNLMSGATDISSALSEAFSDDGAGASALIGGGPADSGGEAGAGLDATGLTALERDAITVKEPTVPAFVDLTGNLNSMMRLPRLAIDRRDFPMTADFPLLLHREGVNFVQHVEKRLALPGRFAMASEQGRLVISGTLDSEYQVGLVRSMARMTPGFEAVRLDLLVAEASLSPPSTGARPPIPLPRSRWNSAPLPPVSPVSPRRGTAPQTGVSP